MDNKHLLIAWDTDIEPVAGLAGYEELTDQTVSYLLDQSADPTVDSGWGVGKGEAERKIRQMLEDFAAFLAETVAPANIRVIVCSDKDRMRLFINSKEPIVYYPFNAMTIEEVENWLIRGALLQKHDRLTRELEECIALLHLNDGVKSIEDINTLRSRVAGFFEQTRFRWGMEFPDTANPAHAGKAVS